MGQVCSCCGAPAKGEGETVTKNSSLTPIPAPVIAAEQHGRGAPLERQATAAAPQTVLALKTLVQQAKSASQGNLLGAEHRGLQESWDEEESGGQQWHDALDDLRLQEVLSKWDEDQQATLARLDRALELLQAKGLAELERPLAAAAEPESQQQQQLARQDSSKEGAAAAAAAAAGAALLPHAVLSRSSLDRVRQGLAAIFDSVHAPHGSAAEALVLEARSAVADHRVLGAERTLHALCDEAGATMAQLTEHGDLLGVDVKAVLREAAEVRAMLAEVDNDKGWMVSRDDEMRLLYKHEKGGTTHSLKLGTVLDHPAEHILALANEFDLIKTWNKFSTDSLKIWQRDIFECVVYGAQWMPRPFKQFYSLIRARGVDLAEEDARCLLILLDDADPGSLPIDAAPLPAATEKRRLCNVRRGCIRVRPLPAGRDGKPRTEAYLMVHIDPHIPLLPAFLINFVLGVLAPYIFAQIKQLLARSFADFNGVYPSRIRAQPEVYGRMRQRLAQFSAQLGLGYASAGGESNGANQGQGLAEDAGRDVAAAPRAASSGALGQQNHLQQSQQQQPQQQSQQQQSQQQQRQLGIWDTFDEATFHDAMEHHDDHESSTTHS